jgi:hypothetical protein
MCGLQLPRNKEPHYWLDGARRFRKAPAMLERIQVQDRKSYEALYARSRLSLDASVGYYHYADSVIEKLKSANVQPKIVMLVREPLSWARSLHIENLYQGLETDPDLGRCLSQDRSDQSLWWQLRYRDIRYLEVYEKLADAFREVMLVDYRDFERSSDLTMRRVCDFLGLKVVANLSTERHHDSRLRIAEIKAGPLRGFVKRLPARLQYRLARLPIERKEGKLIRTPDAFIAQFMAKSLESYAALTVRYLEAGYR